MIAIPEKYGRLTVIGEAPRRAKKRVAMCRCECGTVKPVRYELLKSGKAKSCGCLRRELAAKNNTRHGHATRDAKTAEYRVWNNMMCRCYRPSTDRYERYGGRGITVCERWHDFANFLADMGPRPSPDHSIERDDANGNYDPGNCRWATDHQQRRNTSRSRMIEFRGRRVCITDLAAEHGVNRRTLTDRLNSSQSVEQALGIT